MKPWRNPRVTVPCWAVCGAAMVAAHPSLAVLAAPVVWPVVEYAVHRWGMHGLRRFGANAYRRAHGVHHEHPRDISHFVVPPVAVLAVAIGLLCVLPAALVGGLLVCFALYDCVHLGCHGVGPLRGRLPAAVVAHHAKHHANGDTRFSVTAPPLDRLFGSL